jgi:hypothetical protein
LPAPHRVFALLALARDQHNDAQVNRIGDFVARANLAIVYHLAFKFCRNAKSALRDELLSGFAALARAISGFSMGFLSRILIPSPPYTISSGRVVRSLYLALLASLIVAASAFAAVVYDVPMNNQINGFGGGGGAVAMGQTLTVPIGAPILSDFKVLMTASEAQSFDLKIANWNDAQNKPATVLYQSAATAAPVTYPTFTEVTFPLNLTLTPNVKYIAYLDSRDYPHASSPILMGGNYLDAYPYGDWAFGNTYFSDPWNVGTNGEDLAFGATFTPEPASVTALAGLLLCARRIRRK